MRSSLGGLAIVGVSFVVLLGVSLVVFARADAHPPSTPITTARPGDTCDRPGQRATAEDRSALACTTTIADSTPRWRTGRLDLPQR